MIKHVVLLKLHDTAGGRPKAENMKLLSEMLLALPATISQIHRLEVGFYNSGTGNSWDMGLFTEFLSQADLNIYIDHPDHLNVGNFINIVVQEKVAVDFVLQGKKYEKKKEAHGYGLME